MRRILFACSIVILFAASIAAQKIKPWTEWTEKDAVKILNDSAWGQTQTEGTSEVQPSSTSAITSTTAARENTVKSASAAGNSAESGERKDTAMSVHYRVRLLSAKPIRAALVRMIELQGAPPEKVAQWRPFVDRDFGDYIVITITMDGNDRKRMGLAMDEISKVETESLNGISRADGRPGGQVCLPASAGRETFH